MLINCKIMKISVTLWRLLNILRVPKSLIIKIDSVKHVCIDLFRFYTRAISHNVAAGGIYYPSVSIAQFPAMLNV